MTRRLRAFAVGAVASVAVLILGGCAGYDVEFKGGLFDMAGLSSIGKSKPEPKMKQRTGLVVPPSTASLPVPGSAPVAAPPAVAANGEAWPVDPEQAKAQKSAAIVAQHKAFCEKQRSMRESKLITDMKSGPLGSCEQSILRQITGKRVTELPAQKQ